MRGHMNVKKKTITISSASLSLYNLNELSNKRVTYCIHEIS